MGVAARPQECYNCEARDLGSMPQAIRVIAHLKIMNDLHGVRFPVKAWPRRLVERGRGRSCLAVCVWLGCAFLASVLNADGQVGSRPGEVDESFAPQIQPEGAELQAIAVRPDGKIWIAGDFYKIGATFESGLARLNADGTCDTNFVNDLRAFFGISAIASTLEGGVLAAGTFQKSSSVVRTNLARFLENGQLDETFNAGTGPDRGVNSIAVQPDGRILLGGYFSQMNGLSRVSVARLEANGDVDQSFDVRLDGRVNQIVDLPGGQIVIGGDFQTVNGVPRKAVARLLSNGALDTSFAPDLGVTQTSAFVDALVALPDGTVVLGGGFDFVNGVPSKHIVRLTSAGQVDSSFALRKGPNNRVRRLAAQADGKIIATGWFDQFDGLPFRMVRLTQDGCLDVGFQPRVIDLGPIERIQPLATQPNGGILAAGRFQTASGSNRSGLVRLDGADSGPVRPLISTQPLGRSVVWGGSVTLNADAVSCSPTTFQWQHAGTNLPRALTNSLRLDNISLADAGEYRTVISNAAGATTSAVAMINVVPVRPGLTDPSFAADILLGGGVSALARAPNGMILIGGSFTNVGGLNRAGIARLNSDGRVDPGFVGPGIHRGTNQNVANVSAIVTQDDGKIFIGGSFASVHGVTRIGIARLNADGSLDESFDARAGPVGEVAAIIPSAGGKLYVGGTFFTWDGRSADGIVRLTASGNVDTGFQSTLFSTVSCLYCTPFIRVASLLGEENGSVLVGGGFRYSLARVNEESPASLVRLNADGSINPDFQSGIRFIEFPPPSLTPSRLPYIDAMLRQPDGKILVTGLFHRFGLVRRNWLGRLNPDGSLDSSFDASQDFVPDGYATVSTTAIRAAALQPDGKVLVGGLFNQIDGVPRKNLARLNANGRIDLTFDTGLGADGAIKALWFEPGGSLLVGGDFRTFDGNPRAGLVRVLANPNLSGPPAIVVPPASLLIQEGNMAVFNVFATGSNLGYQWARNNIPLPGETNAVLIVPAVSNLSLGPYTVTVQNDLGSLTSPAAVIKKLDVAEALDTPGLQWIRGGDDFWEISKTGEAHDREDALVALWNSGRKPPWVETTLEGPGKLSYWVWRFTTDGFGTFVYIDGILQSFEPSGWTGWTNRMNVIPPGRHTVRLEMQNGGLVYLDQVAFAPGLPPDASPRLFAERSGTDLILTWPQSTNFFGLETSQSLSSATAWRPVLSAPTLNGSRYEVRVSFPAIPSFYRLRGQ
jgi:uncharacterized delta-60 repeat protein